MTHSYHAPSLLMRIVLLVGSAKRDQINRCCLEIVDVKLLSNYKLKSLSQKIELMKSIDK